MNNLFRALILPLGYVPLALCLRAEPTFLWMTPEPPSDDGSLKSVDRVPTRSDPKSDNCELRYILFEVKGRLPTVKWKKYNTSLPKKETSC